MGSHKRLHVVVTGGADAPRAALDLAFAIGYEVVRRLSNWLLRYAFNR
jgi:hypothetical protein